MCIKFIDNSPKVLYNCTDTYNSCGRGTGCPTNKKSKGKGVHDYEEKKNEQQRFHIS